MENYHNCKGSKITDLRGVLRKGSSNHFLLLTIRNNFTT